MAKILKKTIKISFAVISLMIVLLGLIATLYQGNASSLFVIPILVAFTVSMKLLSSDNSDQRFYWIYFGTLSLCGIIMIIIKLFFMTL